MKKNILGILILSTMVISLPVSFGSALGSNDAGLVNSQYMKDIRTFDLRKENEKRIRQIESPNAAQNISSGTLKSVSFLNNRAFTEKVLQDVLLDYIGQPISSKTIMQMRRTLMKFYQSNGYYSAVAVVEAENPREGSITFRMQEGSKDSIEIDGI